MKLSSPDGKNTIFWDSDPDSFLKDDVFELLKTSFQDNPDTFPLTIIFPLLDNMIVLPVSFLTSNEKIHKLGVISHLMNILKVNWYVIASECWFVVRNIDQCAPSIEPSKCEDKKECLVVMRVERTKPTESAIFNIVRENQSVKFTEEKDMKFSGGRLCELFSMKPTQQIISEVDQIIKNWDRS